MLTQNLKALRSLPGEKLLLAACFPEVGQIPGRARWYGLRLEKNRPNLLPCFLPPMNQNLPLHSWAGSLHQQRSNNAPPSLPHRFSHTFLRPFVSSGKLKSSRYKAVVVCRFIGAFKYAHKWSIYRYVERRSRSDNATDGLFRSRHILFPSLPKVPPITKLVLECFNRGTLRACLFKHCKSFFMSDNAVNPFSENIYNSFCMLILGG